MGNDTKNVEIIAHVCGNEQWEKTKAWSVERGA
jgi:hypothetical protein